MKLLILLSRFPYPLEKGDKLRAYNHIKYLSKKHEIILCAINTNRLHKNAISSLQLYCKKIEIINLSKLVIFINLLRAIFTKKPFQVEYFYNKKAHIKIAKLIKETNPDHIFCQLIRVSEYVKNSPGIKTIDYQDVFSKGIERRLNIAPFYIKWFLKIELKRLLKYENSIFSYFDKKIIISKPDRDLIPHPDKDAIVVIPNGVDTDYFNSSFSIHHSSFIIHKKHDLLFTGNMGYYPNVVSAIYLAKEILPEVITFHPNIKLLIAGANPHKRVRELKTGNINISGWVEDLRECYAVAKIFIAPMIIGTGLQNKLLEAMSMKIPCITSKLANEALGAINGKEIIVCETTGEYVNSILELLNNKEKHDEIANNAYNFITKNFNWNTLTGQLERVINNNDK